MKILHVAEPFATGVLSFLIDLTKRQVEDNDIYILWGNRPLTPSNVEELFDKRIHLIKMDSFKGAIGTVFNPKAYWNVNKLYNKIKPDVVHLHSSASGFVGRWALPCNKVKVFYTPHGFSFLMKDGSKIKRFLFWAIEYISAFRHSKIVACSEGEYKEAAKLSSRSTFVNNGINVSELQPWIIEKKLLGDKITICTNGRILYQKNPTLFNEIAKLLPELNFVWIGDGELKTVLTASNIKVTGWVKREEALKYMQESDIFILTSLWEGLPISLLESMFLKKICIVSNVIGNKDVIHNGINGYICNTAQEYADTIRKIIKGDLNGFLMSENASKDVLLHYNADVMAKQYNDIYNQPID